jgi:hypothetical protein
MSNNNKKAALHCDLCEYTSPKKVDLGRHILFVHLGIRVKYPCDLCHFAANGQYQLSEHILSVHLNVKKWKCDKDKCSFATGHKHMLKIHVKQVHELPRNKFQCELCEHSSFTRQELRSHCLHVHIGVKRWKCAQCSYTTR